MNCICFVRLRRRSKAAFRMSVFAVCLSYYNMQRTSRISLLFSVCLVLRHDIQSWPKKFVPLIMSIFSAQNHGLQKCHLNVGSLPKKSKRESLPVTRLTGGIVEDCRQTRE